MGEGEGEEGHVNLNSYHITPDEPDTNDEIINNSQGRSDNTTWVQHEGKGTHLTIKYTSIFCLAEFRPVPGFCTCQTSKLMTLKKKNFFFKGKKFKQSSIPQFSFKSAGRQAPFSDHQEQKLWLRGK